MIPAMCSYRATGKKFDVRGYFKKTRISKAEPLTSELKSRLNGISIPISDASFGKIKPQIAAASKFLEAHSDELLRLSKDPMLEERLLIFSYAPGQAATISEWFPSDFLLKLGKLRIGIELSVYPGSNKWIDKPRPKMAKAMMLRYRKKRAGLIRAWKKRLLAEG